ncbi:MAG: hypothetical protein JST75_05055 [Bacteroidetes bacterium]|nr:hypothetical protein [Bacteroidota bacterium]
MTNRFLFLIILFFGFHISSSAQIMVANKRVHIGLVYPISSNGTNAGEFTNSFSLHAIGGYSKNEIGFALSGMSNVIVDSASGVQIAGFSNHIQNKAHGVQCAGFMNLVKNETDGVQVAGFLNKTGSLKGVQAAGFINKSGDVNTQAAGFINIARKVKGVQVAGFINIADSSDYSIGIINLIKHGEKGIGVTVDETTTTLLSFRSGGRIMYGIIGAGYNFKNKNAQLFAWEAGIGAHIPISYQFRINAEATLLSLDDFNKKGDYYKSSLRILPAIRLGDHIELFAGPTLNFVHYSNDLGKDLVTRYQWSKTTSDNHFQGLYVGLIGGVQISL